MNGKGYITTIDIRLQFSAEERRAIRKLFGVFDGELATASQLIEFVECQIANATKQLLNEIVEK